MKKSLLLFLTLLMIFLTACGVKEPPVNKSLEYNSETDCQFAKITAGRSSLAESPDGYYYISSDPMCFLRFIDKKTLEDTIVCGKPDCLHEKGNPEQCNAYFDTIPGGGTSLCYYEGKLYLITMEADPKTFSRQAYLTEVSLDGSRRKNIWKMDWKTSDICGNLSHMIIHRGTMYFCVFDANTDRDSPIHIYAYSLATKKCRLISDEFCGVNCIVAVGDYLYFSAFDQKTQQDVCYQYTISGGTFSTLPAEYHAMFFHSNGIFLKQTGSNVYFSANLTGEGVAELKQPIDRLVACNEEYLLVQQQTILHKESGRIISAEEYYEALDNFSAMEFKDREEEALAYQDFLGQYERSFSKDISIWNAKTCTEIGTMTLPCDVVNFFEGDLLICSDQDLGELHRIDLSKFGTADFLWESSRRVN